MNQMNAVVTVGNGSFDKLVFQKVNVPTLNSGEVLIKVLAAGVNNTEINTRLGWYSKNILSSTEKTNETTTGNHLEDGGGMKNPISINSGDGLLWNCRISKRNRT